MPEQPSIESSKSISSEKPRGLRRLFGRVGLTQNVRIEKRERKRAPLPDGYHYAKPRTITAKEEAALKQQVGWDATEASTKRIDRANRRMGIRVLAVGVRDNDDNLVGFGSVVYKGKKGELCDFVVDPAHQGQGIGKAIIDERLDMAEERGIDSLYMPYLEDTNTLRSYYFEQGFHETPEGEIVRGPDPSSITGTPLQPQQPQPV